MECDRGVARPSNRTGRLAAPDGVCGRRAGLCFEPPCATPPSCVSPSPDSTGLLEHRFLLFTGKGGVGKTTLVASLAVHAAHRGHRPLVVELSHRASMRSVFGVPEIDFQPRDVGHGVHAMSMDLDLALLEYVVQHVPSRRLARTILKNKVLERLFQAMPAVGEIATMSKLQAFEAEVLDGRPRWSPILVDLDATGHALMFLELRNVVAGLMGVGPMLRLIEGMADTFADPKRCRLNLVTTPDELPITETIDLHRRLVDAKTVAFGRVLVNRVPMVDLPANARAAIDAVEQAARSIGDAETIADAVHARRVLDASARARACIERLAEAISLPIVELPVLQTARLGKAELLRLGAMACGDLVDRRVHAGGLV